MSKHKYGGKYISLSCTVLCSLLLSACGRETEPPQENMTVLSEFLKEKKETEENANEALALCIEDKGFRECVRYAADIEEEDSLAEVLQKLNNCESIELCVAAYDITISSLESLSLLPNLKQLTIHVDEMDEPAIDFTPVTQLSKLEELSICYGKDKQIDLSFLEQMHTITELFLSFCKIEDFSFLEQMPQLQCLSLYETPIEDLAVLEKLPELVELSLSGNENAKHIEVVGTLTQLQDLEMKYCGIEDIGFLSGLTELQGINLRANSVTDITPLAGLKKLERLELAENRINDISALTELPHLNKVGISDNQIEDLSPLAGKEELMYAAVFGNPIKSMEPLFAVPRLLYADSGVSDEENIFMTDWLMEHFPEAEAFACVDYIQGDLNNDGRQDIAFVADSEVFDVYEGEDFPERLPDTRRLFVLLQQKDGSWVEQEDVPHLREPMSGGLRGDPYRGMFMQAGYLLIEEGGGSSTGGREYTEIYEYDNGSLRLSKTTCVEYDGYVGGYDVQMHDEQTGTWQSFAIATDGYRMVRVDIADSEHLVHKAFPKFYISDYNYNNKIETQISSSEALDLVLETAVGDTSSAVMETLPYAKWQKDGYELLLGLTLPDYYYVLPETQREAGGESEGWAGDYLYYNGIISEDGKCYHVIYLIQEEEKRKFLLDDVTGEISKPEILHSGFVWY